MVEVRSRRLRLGTIDRKVRRGVPVGKVYTIEELRGLLGPLMKKHRMKSASLFGSYARGEATDASDIDILFVAEEGSRPLDVFSIAYELQLACGKPVDAYEISEFKPGRFRDAVEREAVVIWE